MTNHNLLFQRIIQECTSTNNLRQEYEMWLTQEVFESEDVLVMFTKYLNTLKPDENGWIYWFMSQCFQPVSENLYLKKAEECKHPFAICKTIFLYKDFSFEKKIEKLQNLYDNGNIRAMAYMYILHNHGFGYDSNKCDITNAVDKDDFYTTYLFVEKGRGDIHSKAEAQKKLITWGYHIPHNGSTGYDYPSFSNLFFPTTDIVCDTLKTACKNLITLGIPCGYHYLGYMSHDLDAAAAEAAYNFGTGMERGCHACADVLNDFECFNYGIIYSLIQENERLKQLQTLSLEDCIKNVISEYM